MPGGPFCARYYMIYFIKKHMKFRIFLCSDIRFVPLYVDSIVSIFEFSYSQCFIQNMRVQYMEKKRIKKINNTKSDNIIMITTKFND
jgi:hypothetical protein